MARGQSIGREFRCRLQEESKKRNARITESFIEESQTVRGLRETGLALDDGNFRLPGKRPEIMFEECSLREMAAQCIVDRHGHPVGEGYIEEMFNPAKSNAPHVRMSRMREAGDISAVDYSMFAGITGQLLINSTLQGWEHEEFKFTKSAGTYNTAFIDGERVPGVSMPYTADMSNAKEDLLLVKPQQPFPYLTMGSNYIELPATEMRGGIMGVDRLSIYGDRTGLVAKNAAEGARVLGVRKEQRGLQLLIGGDSVAYKEKFLHDSKAYETDPYQYESGSGSYQFADGLAARTMAAFYNDIPANPLTDWHTFEKADIAASKLTDPNNGLPITYRLPTLFLCWTERFNAAIVLKAFETWRISQATNSAPYVNAAINTVGPNVIQEMIGNLDVVPSRMLRQEMIKSGLYSETGSGTPQSDKVYFYGDLREAIRYSTNWNIKVVMAPANSEAEFTQDIILRWRFDERGRWGWHNPRMIQRWNYQAQA